ncbi:MAG: tetratricopeptide repeat protein [Flavobacteriaceae bacterium]|jgi:tetratricopeptide (TPR) repeat protein|nr:tetratricopeptide repeat protein [Flavobacteriaceae bacterium]
MVNKKILFLMFSAFLCFVESNAQESYNRLLFEGNRNFKNKDYEKSSGKFSKAEKINTKDFAAHYNLANSYYKRKMYEEAKSEYQKANQLAQNSADKAAALHNLGNSYMQTNDSQQAAEIYKQALKQNPKSEDTRRNYEIAKLKMQDERQKTQDKNRDSKSKNQEQDGKNQDKNSKKDGGNQQNQTPKNGENKNQEPRAKSQEPTTDNRQPTINNSQQQKILDKISEKEKETARKIMNKSSYSFPESREKDW